MTSLATQLRGAATRQMVKADEDALKAAATALEELAASVDEVSLIAEKRQGVVVVLTRRVETLEGVLGDLLQTVDRYFSHELPPVAAAREALAAKEANDDRPS